MKITLGENLRSLRTKKNITQEQLAEALEVSPQAVSRWENEAAFPDISLLPVLANFFNVTTDFLLGVNIAEKQKEIEKITEADTKLRNKGETRKSVDYLREKIKEYPSEPVILHRLACSLFSLYHQSDEIFSESEKREMAEEALNCCKRALKYNDDPSFTAYCKQTMILNYIELGEKKKAAEIADKLPGFWCSREMVYPKTLSEKAALKEYQENLLQLTDALLITLGRIKSCENYSDEQKIRLSIIRENLILMLAGENPCWLNERLFNLALIRAKIYARQGCTEKLPDILEKLWKYAVDFEEREADGKYTVFWLSECTDNLNGTKHTAKNLYDVLKEFVEKYQIGKFKDNERIAKVLNMLHHGNQFLKNTV